MAAQTTRSVRVVVAAAAVVVAVGAGGASSARADTWGHAGPGGEFGLGFVLGTPTGLSAEYYLSGSNSLHFALGLDALEDESFYFHLNWRGYLASLAEGRSVRLPLYVGLGGFAAGDDIDVVGARAPLGLAIDFRGAPIQLFLEAALELAIVTPADDIDLDVGGAFGLHFYF